jgi:hypothetical protein
LAGTFCGDNEEGRYLGLKIPAKILDDARAGLIRPFWSYIMKKQARKLVLAKETLRNLEAKSLEQVAGGAERMPVTGTGGVGGTAGTCLVSCTASG